MTVSMYKDPSANRGQLIAFDPEDCFEYVQDAWLNLWLRPLFKTSLAVTLLMLFFCIFFGCASGAFDAFRPAFISFLKDAIRPLLPFLRATATGDLWHIGTPVTLMTDVILAASGYMIAMDYSNRPSHLAISQQGLWFCSKMAYAPSGKDNYSVRKYIPFYYLQSITVERPWAKRSTLDYNLVFLDQSGRTEKLRIGDIINPAERRRFLAMLRNYANEFVAPEVFEALDPPSDRESYTDIWLKELSAAPRRDKLKPLEQGAHLENKRFTIVRKLGMGGQATVYLARDAQHPDMVALKEYVLPIFPSASVRKNAAEKFETESRLLARLDHPKIAKLFDIFIEDHRAYLVLERVTGKTLKQVVDEGCKIYPDDVRDLAMQMCEILQFLHSQNPPVIHRDFTPDNLMLQEDGTLKLIDFTVAQELQPNVTGTVVGKHNYMSPEQFRGKPTGQSDIYSMCASLFFLLTGQEPEAISQLHPHKVDPSIPETWDRIIAKGTALDTTKRYASVDELYADLTGGDRRVGVDAPAEELVTEEFRV